MHTSLSLQQAFLLASQHYQAGRLVEAVAVLEQICRVAPQWSDAVRLLVQIELDRNNPNRAYKVLQQSLSVHSESSLQMLLEVVEAKLISQVGGLIERLDELNRNPRNIAILEQLTAQTAGIPKLAGFLYEGFDTVCRAGIISLSLFDRMILPVVDMGNIALAERLVRMIAAAVPSPRNDALLKTFLQAFRETEPVGNAAIIGSYLAQVERDYHHKVLRRMLGDTSTTADADSCISFIPFSEEARRQTGRENGRANCVYEATGNMLIAHLRTGWQTPRPREEAWRHSGSGTWLQPITQQDRLLTPVVSLPQLVLEREVEMQVHLEFTESALRSSTLAIKMLALTSPNSQALIAPFTFRQNDPTDRAVTMWARLPRSTRYICLALSLSGRLPVSLPTHIRIDHDSPYGAFITDTTSRRLQNAVLV